MSMRCWLGIHRYTHIARLITTEKTTISGGYRAHQELLAVHLSCARCGRPQDRPILLVNIHNSEIVQEAFRLYEAQERARAVPVPIRPNGRPVPEVPDSPEPDKVME